jgi:hypothetical protein
MEIGDHRRIGGTLVTTEDGELAAFLGAAEGEATSPS